MSECRAEDIRPRAIHLCNVDTRVEAFEGARHQWPSVRLTFEQFNRHLEAIGYSQSLPAHIGELYLCAACALGMNAACVALDSAYFPALRSAIVRHGQPSDFVEDVLQQVRERLLGGPKPRIASYRGSGALSSWLRMVACNLAMDGRRRRRRSQKALRFAWLVCPESYTEEQTFPEALALNPRNTEMALALESLLHESVARLSEPDRQILGLYYFQNVPVNEIGERTQLYRSTVYRQLRRAERRLARRITSLIQSSWCIAEREECLALMRKFAGLLNLQAAFSEQTPNDVAAE